LAAVLRFYRTDCNRKLVLAGEPVHLRYDDYFLAFLREWFTFSLGCARNQEEFVRAHLPIVQEVEAQIRGADVTQLAAWNQR
jgi:hypothetical protein